VEEEEEEDIVAGFLVWGEVRRERGCKRGRERLLLEEEGEEKEER
jgi:hypothetical protein